MVPCFDVRFMILSYHTFHFFVKHRLPIGRLCCVSGRELVALERL